MAEKENSSEKFSTIQGIPEENVSIDEHPTTDSMVQALVADQSALALSAGRRAKN